jgi:hypothetical protein
VAKGRCISGRRGMTEIPAVVFRETRSAGTPPAGIRLIERLSEERLSERDPVPTQREEAE